MEYVIDLIQAASLTAAGIAIFIVAFPLGILIGLGVLWLILTGLLLLLGKFGVDTQEMYKKVNDWCLGLFK